MNEITNLQRSNSKNKIFGIPPRGAWFCNNCNKADIDGAPTCKKCNNRSEFVYVDYSYWIIIGLPLSIIFGTILEFLIYIWLILALDSLYYFAVFSIFIFILAAGIPLFMILLCFHFEINSLPQRVYKKKKTTI
jgi:hypothetical protein